MKGFSREVSRGELHLKKNSLFSKRSMTMGHWISPDAKIASGLKPGESFLLTQILLVLSC